MSVSLNLNPAMPENEWIEIQCAIALVEKDGMALEHLDEWLRDNEEVVTAAVENNGLALQFVSERLQNDWGTVNLAVADNGLALEFASGRLQNNWDIAYNAFLQKPAAGAFIGYRLRGDRSFLRSLVTKKDCSILAIADLTLTIDQNFMSIMVQINGLALKYAGREAVIELVRENANLFEFASLEHRNDPEIAELATDEDPEFIQFAGKDAVLALVEQTPELFQYASQEHRNDSDIAVLATDQVPELIQYAGRNAALALVWADAELFRFASPENRNDLYIASAATTRNPQLIQFAGKDAVIELIRGGDAWLTIQYTSEAQRNNREIMMVAVDRDGETFAYASQRLRGDFNLAKVAVEDFPEIIQYASRGVILRLLGEVDGLLLEHVGRRHQGNEETVLTAAKQNPKAIKFAHKVLQYDQDFRHQVNAFHPNNFGFVSA